MRSTLVAVLLLAAPAHADPDDLVARPLVLDDGALDVRLTMEVGVQQTAFARPLSFAPDAWWGVSPHWTLGVIHSQSSVDQIDAGASFCVRHSAVSPCDRLYRGSGVDVRYGALDGTWALAPRVRLLVRDIDPFKPAVTLGALVRWTRGRFAIASDPYVRLPLANAELGNRAAISIPLWLAVQPARGWMVRVHTGFDADVIVIRDGSHGPFGVEVATRLTAELDLAVEAGWARLFGPQYDAKHAAILISAGWHRGAIAW